MTPRLRTHRQLPAFIGTLIRPLPLFPLEQFLRIVLKTVIARHPEVFKRMGKHAGVLFLIEPTDLPFLITLDTSPRRPDIRLSRNKPQQKTGATITGSILQHLKMLTGQVDGDALFFSRDISISGDTEAVLALRNAVDSIDLNIFKRKHEDSFQP